MPQQQEREITSNIDLLLSALPPHISGPLEADPRKDDLLEIVIDLGRLPEARFRNEESFLSDREITLEDIEYVTSRIGAFGEDNRAGFPRTLHRISAIRNRAGLVIGLTCRVGRAVYGTIPLIRDLIEEGGSVLLLGKPGVGKCVTGDSLVLTQDGFQQLAELVPDGLEDDQFAPISETVIGMNGLEPASHAYSGGWSETLRVTTRQGFSLEGTPEHPLLAIDENGDLVFRRLDQLKPGDYLAIQRGQGCFGQETRLPAFEFVRRTNALNGKVPAELDEGLARFLGYLVAEGTLSFSNEIGFCHTDPQIQADMQQLTEELFDLPLRKHLYQGEWNGKDFRVHSVKLRRFLEHLGLRQGRSADKRIPPCILTAPKHIAAAFLRALFEGDGSIYGPVGRVEIASASRELLAHLHILLLNFGIVGNLRAKFNRTYERNYYYLTLLGENVTHFANEIGFISTRKRSKLAEFVTKHADQGHNPNTDVIPYQNDRLRELRRELDSPSSKLMRFTRADNRAPSYTTINQILGESQAARTSQAYQTLEVLEQTNFFFDPVAKIEEGEAAVYDLSVPGSHSFFANGFISHNTTLLREVARVLADEFRKRVVIVDTSNEIAGDGDIPHPGIGRARRMQVVRPSEQHAVMIEAVENHMPEVIIIDEIGTELEAQAARTIAERGVQLVGTAHGNTLENLMLNPTLSDLIGGIQAVTLGDEEARRRGTQKTVLERKAPPTFNILVEIQSWDDMVVYREVDGAVDSILRGEEPMVEMRHRDADGQTSVENARMPRSRDNDMLNRQRRGTRVSGERGERGERGDRHERGERYDRHERSERHDRHERSDRNERGRANLQYTGNGSERGRQEQVRLVQSQPERDVKIFPFGISRNRLEKAIERLKLPATLVRELDEATIVMTLKNYYRQNPARLRHAEERSMPIYVLRSNTQNQMETILANIFELTTSDRSEGDDDMTEAMEETEEAIGRVINGEQDAVELSPQGSFIRRIQHQMAERYNLQSESTGREPRRRVRIFR